MRAACPDNYLKQTWGDGRVQEFRWVNQLVHEDSEGRLWQFNALACQQTTKEGEQTQWAWVTSLAVDRDTAVDVALRGGRQRWRES